MSTSPDFEFDLEQVFLPSWAKQQTADASRYARYDGTEEVRGGRRRDGGGDRGGRPPRRDGPGGGGQGRGPSRGPQGGGGGGRGERRPGGDRRSFGAPQEGGFERREPVALPEVEVSLIPELKGVESIARQIKLSGRAYPLFDIAQLLLKKPERYDVKYSVIKKADGKVAQGLFLCSLDDTLWLSENDAVQHLLGKQFDTFYQTEKIAGDAPKGVYTFVAQCGMSGVVLGPPNYHDYQNKLRRLHTERFSRIPFEAYKARVKIVKDEAIVKKWLEDQSFKTEYVALNVPEPLRFTSREDVERHFRETHLPNLVKSVDSRTINGAGVQALLSGPLKSLYRQAWDDQVRFPIKVVTVLSQQLAGHGLQFFKVNKTVTHVAVARPHFLDMEATPVSEGIKKIVDFINATPKCTRRKILETLAPAPAAPAPAAAAPAPAPAAGTEAAPATPAAPLVPPPTPEQSAIISSLHWLIHQGHVIEFANGLIETAKKPLPKPVKAAPAPKAAPAAPAAAAPAVAAPAAEAATTEAPAPVAEAAPAAPTEPPATA